jgi:hypothetical protein
VIEQSHRGKTRPAVERLVEPVMGAVHLLVGERGDAERTPSRAARVVGERVADAVIPKPSSQVGHDHVGVAVADEQDAVLREHTLEEASGPRVAQVGPPEVPVGHHEPARGLTELAMQVDQAVEVVAHRQRRRKVLRQPPTDGVEDRREVGVVIGGDDPGNRAGGGQRDDRLVQLIRPR